MSITWDVSELNHLVADLSAAPEKAKAEVYVVTRKTAFDIEADAKIFAPVDTGNLMNSISVSFTMWSYTGIEAEIGPTAAYGHYVEEGTTTQAPAAYMGPAFDRRAPAYEQALGIILERAIG